jgi:hypothetical protein
MVMGKLGPQQAFLMRKLKIQGSMGLAMKLQPILVRAGGGVGVPVGVGSGCPCVTGRSSCLHAGEQQTDVPEFAAAAAGCGGAQGQALNREWRGRHNS